MKPFLLEIFVCDMKASRDRDGAVFSPDLMFLTTE